MFRYFSIHSIVNIFFNNNIPSYGLHATKAFPLVPGGQEQMGIWLVVKHWAFCPQVPMHGSIHLLRTHALLKTHSSFPTHSGLQPMYGSPVNSLWHVQIPSRQFALGPHGDGLHKSVTTGSDSKKNNRRYIFSFVVTVSKWIWFVVKRFLTNRLWLTWTKWITSVSFSASTYRNMIKYITKSFKSAGSRTWISTSIANAS